ncbi:hypothetical protein RGU12_02230 [Fredinandcohnia sp. QZ13]|uniref:hypothetical protein n=1 Tax=Fredinandcohnia sp. QZ13 TaxID=3073144 RepID=UPI002852FC93|nr:hypothetical protein [Fredinandcohnia sp. QZ13]MDR4886361.1 hypothetical protein [Fredinandcohnia sp. QZ13]
MSVGFHIPLFIGFLPGFIFLVSLISKKGTPVRKMWKVCKRGVSKTQTVILILFLVSFILPSWYEAGTVNLLVSIALQIITPDHFFLFSFMVAMLFSMMLFCGFGLLVDVSLTEKLHQTDFRHIAMSHCSKEQPKLTLYFL